MEGVSIPGRIRGMKRWGREDRVARPWSTRRRADGNASGHDKGRRGTKRHRWLFLEYNGRVCERRVTKVTPSKLTECHRGRASLIHGICRPKRSYAANSAAIFFRSLKSLVTIGCIVCALLVRRTPGTLVVTKSWQGGFTANRFSAELWAKSPSGSISEPP